MANPNLAALTANKFVEAGPELLSKKVMNWNLKELGVEVRTNVSAPQALPKIGAEGEPRPYAAADHTNGNGVAITDRILTAYLSKWDYDFDPEEFRNTYLANLAKMKGNFVSEAAAQIAKEYLDKIYRNTLYLGVRNGTGTTAAAICDGWGTIIAAEITAENLTAVATGALSSSNAVTKVEQHYDAFPAWMKEVDAIIYCSRNNFSNYARHYRTLNGFKADIVSTNDIRIDNTNTILRAAGFMGTSGRLIGTVAGNLVFGTDVESVKVAASVRRNIVEARPMMNVGCQIKDLAAIVVNDQA